MIAHWDGKHKIWYSESNLEGLHIEAETFEEFRDLVHEFAAELIVANHISTFDLNRRSIRDLIPAVVTRQYGNDLH